MASDPYTVLGLPLSASREEAKQAYRRLAMEHHPDRGGDEVMFKRVKASYEAIEGGWMPPPPVPEPARSSFGDGPRKKKPWGFKPDVKTAGKPAAGYEARGAPIMPRTYFKYKEHFVDLEISTKQGFEGCTVPFVHQGKVLEFAVRPGTMAFNGKELFRQNEMIGQGGVMIPITVTLRVHDDIDASTKPTEPDPRQGNMKVTMKISALGLFIGGKVTTADHLNEPVYVTVPAGYNPSEPIVVKGRGYGTADRADLIITIEPVFKVPSELNSNELRQLQRLNEMTKL